MAIFTPKFIFKDVSRITLDFLQKNNIKALALDVDNTLTAHGSQHLAPSVEKWIVQMKEGGIKLMIASNNYEARVAPFAAKLGLDYVSFSCKPSPKWLIGALKKWGLPKKQVALVGDQIFTDVLAGQLYGVKVLLVKAMEEDVNKGIRLKRHLEKPFIDNYYKKGGKLL